MNEEIGALLDGRLESGPRTELLARLAASDDDYDVFADTAAVLREAEEGETAANEPSAVPAEEPEDSADVIPLRPRRASVWQGSAVRWLAAAAVLAGLALVPVLRSRSNAWRDLGHLGSLASASGAALPDDWKSAWDTRHVMRGGPFVAEEAGTAAQLGALQVDLEVAARSGSFGKVSTLAARMAVLLGNRNGGGGISLVYSELVRAADRRDPQLPRSVAGAGEDLAEFFGDDTSATYLALGGWTEAARLAVARQDTAFFRGREARKALEAVANLGGLGDEANAAEARLRTIVDQRQVPNWSTLKEDLDTLQDELARSR
ncbi:MAG: hypothetical protein ACJ8GN_22910 [Longimicrobiaceae bacterium]